MKKKLLSLLLILAMVLTLAPTMALAEGEGGEGGDTNVTTPGNTTDPSTPDPDEEAKKKAEEEAAKKKAEEEEAARKKAEEEEAAKKKAEEEEAAKKKAEEEEAAKKKAEEEEAAKKKAEEEEAAKKKEEEEKKQESTTKDKTITKVEISKPSNVTVGGTVSFSVASVNGDTSLKSAVSVGTVTWKKSDGTADTSGSATKAPSTAGTYSVEITVTAATDYKLDSGVSPVKLSGIEVKAATNPVNPSSVTYNPSTGLLSWTMPSTVTESNAVSSGNSEFSVNIQDSDGKNVWSRAITLAYKGTGSAYTVTMKDSTFSATVPQPSSLTVKSQYTLVIWNSDVTSGTVKTTFTAVDTTTAVPSASSVTSPEAAAEALETVQKMDTSKLASSLTTALSAGVTTSSSTKPTDAEMEAAKKVLSDLAALDKAIQKQANIKVDVVSAANVPSTLSVSSITVDNAALNAKEAKNSVVELGIYASHTSHLISDTYNSDTAVAFGMSMSNVVSTSNLVVPVVITMPVPAGLTASKVVVLHYHSGGDTFSTIYPSVSGSSISFVVTGFSDFVLAETADKQSSTTVTTPGFPDVPASSTFAAPIAWAQQNGILGGYSDGTFRPDNSTTRQALWMVLARMSGANPADMAAARTWSINSGVSDGTNPGNPLTRQQLITMLYRFAQQQGKAISGSADLSGYSDNNAVANYAQEALAWGVGNGIITGTADGRLNPQGTATRAHFAAFLYRYANL